MTGKRVIAQGRMKRDVIFEQLRRQILAGEYPAGIKLPDEPELAKVFGVARDTLREALKMLEKEGMLERIRGRGTFVRCPRNADRDRTLTLLIPCDDYLSVFVNPIQRRRYHTMLHCLLDEAGRASFRLNTLVFSRTNDPCDPDWERLAGLPPGTRLLVPGLWYQEAFRCFEERKYRVALLRRRDFALERYMPVFDGWIDFFLDSCGPSFLGVKKLRSLGCRVIANAGSWVDDPFNNKTLGYREAVKDMKGMPDGGISIPFPNGSVPVPEIRAAVQSAWRKYRFDGLFLENAGIPFDTSGSLNQCLGIPDRVRILSFFDPEQNLQFTPQISALEFESEIIYRDIARLLLSEDFIPVRKRYDMRFHDRESTGGPHEEPPPPPKADRCEL